MGSEGVGGGVESSLLIWGEVGLRPGIGLEGWLRWCVFLFVVSSAGEHVQYPAFAPYPSFFPPGSSEIAVGCFLSLYLLVQNLSQLHMHTIISPIKFLCILLLKERCAHVQTLHQGKEGCQVLALSQ